MNPYLVRVGSRGFNLCKVNFWEQPGPETDVKPGHVRFAVEPGVIFDLDGENAELFLGHLDRLIKGLPWPCAEIPKAGIHLDPHTGEILRPDAEAEG